MLSPILYAIDNFDAANGTTIKFYYTGEQIFANKLIIKNNNTLEVVYEQKISSMQLYHEISPILSSSVLENGTTYIATITVFDKNDNESPESNSILFTCYTTPVFAITNISDGDIIEDASYPVQLTYNQAENIPLSQYILTLYDYGHNQIWTSGAIYNDSTLNITINGLIDNSSYYIRATGNTASNIELDTGFISFSVNIVNPNTFLVMNLENISDESSVKVTSNIVIVEGRSDGEISYIDNSAVDTTNGSKVIFDDGFSLKKNYTIGGIWKNLKDYSTIMEISNGKNSISVSWNKGDFGNGDIYYAELIATTHITNSFELNYIITSNQINLSSDNSCVKIVIHKEGNLFDIFIEDLGEVSLS